MNEGTFWFVQKIGGGPSTVRHSTKEIAVNEAKRLAEIVGGEYLVLKAEALVKRVTVQVVELADYMPF
jgi:hypothetical protein